MSSLFLGLSFHLCETIPESGLLGSGAFQGCIIGSQFLHSIQIWPERLLKWAELATHCSFGLRENRIVPRKYAFHRDLSGQGLFGGWDRVRWVPLKSLWGVYFEGDCIHWDSPQLWEVTMATDKSLLLNACLLRDFALFYFFYKKSQLFHSVLQVPTLESTCPKVGIIFLLFTHPTHLLQPTAPPYIPCLVNDIICCPS